MRKILMDGFILTVLVVSVYAASICARNAYWDGIAFYAFTGSVIICARILYLVGQNR